jgi:hypothetical protein
LPLLGWLPADPGVQTADRLGAPVYDYAPRLREAAEKIALDLLHNLTVLRDESG